MLTGVILAGGNNSRMNGRNKALLPFSNEVLIQRQIRLIKPICSELIIVTNHPVALKPFELDSVRLISDQYCETGPLGGLHAALTAASNDDVWVVACDMPFISADAAKHLLKLKRMRNCDAAIPYIDQRAQPLHGIYDKRSLGVITDLLNRGEYRLSSLLEAIHYETVHSSKLLEHGIDSCFAMNVNTPKQYESALNQLEDDMEHRKHAARFDRKAIQVEEAQKRIKRHIQLIDIEEIGLEQCWGRRLAESISASHPMPHFPRSGMDGFAIQAESTKGTNQPVLLEVIEHIPCGSVPSKTVNVHTASRIMTGAMIPEGADSVVMLEMAEVIVKEGKTFVSIRKEIKAGQNVTAVGLELAKGEFLLEKGRKIGAGEAALLATFGYARVKVFKRPRVAILSTGSELLNIDEPLELGKIRNSNSHMLAAQILEAGGIPVTMGWVPDRIDSARKLIFEALSTMDLVITTGGVSVGDYDILTDIFADWEGTTLFNKVTMRPGSPTTAGVWKDKLLFALSGNPGACFVGFELFVKPVIWGMQGKNEMYLSQITAHLSEDYPKVNNYQRYVRGYIYVESGKVYVKQAGIDQSSITVSIKDSNGLILIPPGGNGLKSGNLVSVLKLNEVE